MANAQGLKTQAGYFISFTTSDLNKGKESPLSLLFWQSFKLRRAVGSTLGAECQALREGLGHMIYFSRMLAEATCPGKNPHEAVRERGGHTRVLCECGLRVR